MFALRRCDLNSLWKAPASVLIHVAGCSSLRPMNSVQTKPHDCSVLFRCYADYICVLRREGTLVPFVLECHGSPDKKVWCADAVSIHPRSERVTPHEHGTTQIASEIRASARSWDLPGKNHSVRKQLFNHISRMNHIMPYDMIRLCQVCCIRKKPRQSH